MRWCGDLTEIPTDEGKLYLAGVLDLHSRRCVGFAMDAHHDAELARAALCMAIAVRGGAVDGVIFHTDQGGEYTGALFAQACARAGITQSMGRTGSALDNAVAESFNSTLEFELLRGSRFTTREQARHAVAAWIEEYNTVRRHSTNQMLSPVDYERRQATARPGRATRPRDPAQGSGAGCAGETEAAAPPLSLLGPRRAGYGAAPPASRVATAIAAATALRAALDPGASAAPGQPATRAGHGPAPPAHGTVHIGHLPGQDQARACPADHGTGSRSQILIEATSIVPRNM